MRWSFSYALEAGSSSNRSSIAQSKVFANWFKDFLKNRMIYVIGSINSPAKDIDLISYRKIFQKFQYNFHKIQVNKLHKNIKAI